MEKVLTTPLKEEEIRGLSVGDVVYLSGNILTSRDMAHLTMKNLIKENKVIPEDLNGAAVFHAGPVARKKEDGWTLSVIGPTTSIRMEPYADMIGKLGVRVIIGKGGMGEDSLKAFEKYGTVYLQAPPGCAVKLAEGIKKIKNVHWLDFGMPEAMWVMEAGKFGPFVVAMDSHGNSIYNDLRQKAFNKVEKLYQS